MKTGIFATIILSVVVALGVGLSVFAFLVGQYVPGGVLCAFTLFALITLIGFILRSKFATKCDKLILARDYSGALAEAERASRNVFYPLMRMSILEFQCVAEAGLDDLPAALQTIERLRNGGGQGWKYRTAYVYILIKLDEGDRRTARREFEDFRAQNEGFHVYREQIEVLEAIFARLTSQDEGPLPQSVLDSRFPVVQRILGKHAEKNLQAWEDD